MPATVLAVASGKGGVGKTTTAVNLGLALWNEGKSIGLIDADLGMPNVDDLLGLDGAVTLHDALAGRASIGTAGVSANKGKITVIPGDPSLQSFADIDPNLLASVIDELATNRDFVLVDTGAGISYEDVLPLQLADSVLLVTTPDPTAIGDTRKTFELAEMVHTPVSGVVVTRTVDEIDPEAVAREIGADLIGAVPEDLTVSDSVKRGKPLLAFAPNAPATAAYREIARAIINRYSSDSTSGAAETVREVKNDQIEAESFHAEQTAPVVAENQPIAGKYSESTKRKGRARYRLLLVILVLLIVVLVGLYLL